MFATSHLWAGRRLSLFSVVTACAFIAILSLLPTTGSSTVIAKSFGCGLAVAVTTASVRSITLWAPEWERIHIVHVLSWAYSLSPRISREAQERNVRFEPDRTARLARWAQLLPVATKGWGYLVQGCMRERTLRKELMICRQCVEYCWSSHYSGGKHGTHKRTSKAFLLKRIGSALKEIQGVFKKRTVCLLNL